MLGSGGAHDDVVLDGITFAINHGFVAIESVPATMRERQAYVHVGRTGRNAPDALVELADTVTEMKAVKHPFERGERAWKDIGC